MQPCGVCNAGNCHSDLQAWSGALHRWKLGLQPSWYSWGRGGKFSFVTVTTVSHFWGTWDRTWVQSHVPSPELLQISATCVVCSAAKALGWDPSVGRVVCLPFLLMPESGTLQENLANCLGDFSRAAIAGSTGLCQVDAAGRSPSFWPCSFALAVNSHLD